MRKAPESTKRMCASCGITDTSQWRYGHSINILLCNACGIRWKRKNKATSSARMKPGPKSKSLSSGSSLRFSVIPKPRATSSSSVPGSRENQTVNNSPRLPGFNASNKDQLEKKLSYSSSASKTNKKSKVPRCPKMSLDRLICSENSESDRAVSGTVQHPNNHFVIPFRITKVLNHSQEEFRPILYS